MSVALDVPCVDLDNFQDGESEQGLLNGNALFSQESSENVPVKEARVFKRAKRLTKTSPRKEENGVNGLSAVNNNAVKLAAQHAQAKNSRKSRGLHGRGLPKKGGAGGKGVWGKPGSELEDIGETKDVHDPNYDSDSQDTYTIKTITLEMSDAEFVQAVKPALQEYLEHGDSKEVMEVIKALNIASKKHKLPEVAVSIAMDRHDPQRELTSQLLSDLTGQVLTQEEIGKGFNDLLANLNDLTLDTPDAPAILGQFIARAIADDCLPSNFIEKYKGNVESPYILRALEKAEVLLTMKHGIAHLHNVWGVGGGNRPVKNLKNKIVDLLKEYLNSGDMVEAERCLRDLDVPHFHHELVYVAAVIAIEESSQRAIDMMGNLLKSFTSSNVVTPTCFAKGVRRLYDDMPDICLDVPAAYCLLERLGTKLHREGVLSEALLKEMPSRGRKRFVSEGDGGKVKENGSAQAK